MKLENRLQVQDNQDNKNAYSQESLCIAYVIEKFPSPTEYFILNELLELQKCGVELYVLVLRKQKRYLYISKLNDLRLSTIFLPAIYFFFPVLFFSRKFLSQLFLVNRKGLSFCSSLKYLRNYQIGLFFARRLRTRNINHVHAHFAFIAVDIASVLSRLLGIKYSFTAHARDIYTNIPKIQQVIKDASFTVTCTQYNRHYLNKISHSKYADKIFTVYHGVEITKWLSNLSYHEIRYSEIRILSVARLVEKKGLIYLLKAIRLLVQRNIQVTCTIIGEGPQKECMENYIKDNGLENFVRLVNFLSQEQIKNFLAHSDIFILPSVIAKDGDRDGLPSVILEAMLNGVPIISTPVSGIPEIIKDRITGILVREKDGKAIADAVIRLKNSPELYYKITSNGRKEVIEKFDLEENTNDLKKIFEDNILGFRSIDSKVNL